MWIQEPDLEELIRRRQKVMAPNEPALQQALEEGAHSYAYLVALDLVRTSQLLRLVSVLEALTSEIAGARDAVEHERMLRRLT